MEKRTREDRTLKAGLTPIVNVGNPLYRPKLSPIPPLPCSFPSTCHNKTQWQSQEISSPPSNTSSGRVAENVQGRGDPAPAERDAAGAEAGREITDIDRRLGELHEFLKRAKAGVGTGVRVPLPPPSLSRRAGDGLPANGDGQVVPLSTPLRSGGALSNSRFEGASSGGDGTRRSMTSASEGRVFGEAGWRGGEEMRRSVRGSGVLAASLGERRRGDEDVDGRERECGDREGKEE